MKTVTEKFPVVGVQHYLTASTRNFIRHTIDERGPLELLLQREPENEYDRNAIMVLIAEEGPYLGMQIGHLPRRVAEVLAPSVDAESIRLGGFLIELGEETGLMAVEITRLVRKKRPKVVLDPVSKWKSP